MRRAERADKLRIIRAGCRRVEIGFKFRDKSKGRDRNETNYTTPSTLKLTNYLETGFDLPPISTAATTFALHEPGRGARSSIDAPFTGVLNHARDAENFDGTERTFAGYAMAEIYAGQKLFLLPGFRYESTTDDFTAATSVSVRMGRGWAASPSSRRPITACPCLRST